MTKTILTCGCEIEPDATNSILTITYCQGHNSVRVGNTDFGDDNLITPIAIDPEGGEEWDESQFWLCVCGHYEESPFHCSNCGRQPSWGCDCSDCNEEQYEEDIIYYPGPWDN